MIYRFWRVNFGDTANLIAQMDNSVMVKCKYRQDANAKLAKSS